MNKDCAYFEELISRASDKDLSKAETDELMSHLERCEKCAELYNIYSIVYGKAEVASAPDELFSSVMNSIPDTRIPDARKKVHRRIYFTVAAAACACFIMAFLPKLFPGEDMIYGSTNESAVLDTVDEYVNQQTIIPSEELESYLKDVKKSDDTKLYSTEEIFFLLDELPDYITSPCDEDSESVIHITEGEYRLLLSDGYTSFIGAETERSSGKAKFTLIYSE